MRIQKIVSILLVVLFLATGCGLMRTVSQERIFRAQNSKGDICIGIAWPLKSLNSRFLDGVNFACEKINAAGGIAGRKIKIIPQDDESSVTNGLVIAQNFAENPDIVAVIGHYNSYISIPASSIYENAGVIMFSPSSTSPKLTAKGNRFVFRNIPNDLEFGRQLANFAKNKGYKKVIIYYVKNDYGRGLANSFEDRATELDMNIVYRISYEGGTEKEFESVLSKWENFEYDALFLAGTIPEAAEFVKIMREKGVKVPILGGDGLDNTGYLEIAGDAANGTYVASVFNPGNTDPAYLKFKQEFSSKFKADPDLWAAQGYDALMIIAEAIKRAGLPVPEKVADEIRKIKNFKGVTGNHTFVDSGDVTEKDFVIKLVKHRQFTFYQDLKGGSRE